VSTVDSALVGAIQRRLRDAADPERAPQMRAYLKSKLPCLGVPVPLTRSIVKSEAQQRPPRSVAVLGATAAALWRSARYREERHAATALTGLRLARGEISLLPLYQEMIATGAWWDHVDEVAHRICAILLAQPDRTRPVLLAWSGDPDLWLRRSAVISQLDAREATDTALLRAVILANVADREFFIRKAIGWALRQYARSDPDWVRSFVSDHADLLSPLSRREATKHLDDSRNAAVARRGRARACPGDPQRAAVLRSGKPGRSGGARRDARHPAGSGASPVAEALSAGGG
jgi:3-methyladenine DNA glycosylase AlkD